MTDTNDGKTNEALARELMRRGNHYAAQQEWGSAMTMFEDAVEALASCTPSKALRSYALAHLADATVQKLVGLYGMNQLLNPAAIPALEKVQPLYDEALEHNDQNAWALAHQGELFRLMANCILDTNGDFLVKKRIENYELSIRCFCAAIKLYPKTQNLGIAWACAHLGAVVVNARAFIGIRGKKSLKPEILVEVCKVAGVSLKDVPTDPREVCLTYLKAATRLLVRALASDGFYYPWAHAYYGASLLLQGALGPRDFSDSVDVASLGQVVTSQAYYLDPRLLAGVFEPGHLSVNPPLELAFIHYAWAFQPGSNGLMECQRAWAFAWIAAKWPFKYAFLEGLQTLTVCWALAAISYHYINLRKDSGLPKESLPNYGLLLAAGFEPQAPNAKRLNIPMTIIDRRDKLDDFIDSAFEKFRKVQLNFVLQDGIKLDSNLKTSLIVTFKVLGQLACICDNTEIQDKIRGTKRSIHQKLGLQPSEEIGRDTTTDGDEILRLEHLMFSLFTQDTVSIDLISSCANLSAPSH